MAKHSWGNADFVGKHAGRARPARCKVRRNPPARAYGGAVRHVGRVGAGLERYRDFMSARQPPAFSPGCVAGVWNTRQRVRFVDRTHGLGGALRTWATPKGGRNSGIDAGYGASTVEGTKRSEMRLLFLLLGCRHRRTTFPLTAGRRTYVCCLSCGREIDYDWHTMRRARIRWSGHRKHS